MHSRPGEGVINTHSPCNGWGSHVHVRVKRRKNPIKPEGVSKDTRYGL